MSTLQQSIRDVEEAYEPVPYAEVQALDVLHLDDFMQILPALTSEKRLDVIVGILGQTVRNFDASVLESSAKSLAALRDFDFLITSAHKIEALSYKRVEALESLLRSLGHSAQHSPRGSNFTYGLFNPDNERMRTFTGRGEERVFIHAVQRGSRYLDDSVLVLRRLSATTVQTYEFERLADDLANQFEYMVLASVEVLRTVPPEVFSREIVSFFTPLDIGGETFQGITGAQIQNIVIDYILFGLDINDPEYREYAHANLSAMLPFHKRILSRTVEQLGGISLLSKVEQELASINVSELDRAISSLTSLHHFLKRVLSFRRVHRKLAFTNLPLRKQLKGSGGYSLDLLDYLICRTQEAAQRIVKMKRKLI